jgi:hypothetical protein
MDELKIQNAIVKAKPGLEKYQKIMSMVTNVNVSQNVEYQKSFNGFYRVRQRQPIFYNKFYYFMEKNKNDTPSFEKTLRYIYEELGRVEASFSSKLVATINPDLPIWDTVVLKNLEKKPPAYYRKNRLEETILLYEDIKNEYKRLLSEDTGKQIIQLFDQEYPNSGITNIKKVDFVFWQTRE